MSEQNQDASYSALDQEFLAGVFHVKVERMSEEELDILLRMPTWTPLEAMHVACQRKLVFPSSYFITEEMGYVIKKMKEGVQNRELKPVSVSPKSTAHDQWATAMESEGFTLKVALRDRSNLTFSPAIILEWMINNGLPLPDMIFQKIGVVPLAKHSFESYWQRKRMEPFANDTIIHPVSKPRRERLQQKIAAQCFLFEKRKKTTLDEIEKSCEKLGYIPNGGYEGTDTFEENVREVLPKTIRCVGPKRFQQVELKALSGIFSENPKLCLDLRELKIICQCIATVLHVIRSGISNEEIFLHPLTQQYMSGCHPVILTMHQNWLKQTHKNPKIGRT